MSKTIARRDFLIAGAVAGAAGLGAAAWKFAPGILSARSRVSRPNIVMITMDTTRFDRLGFNGYARATTPTLDRLAERGVNFRCNYAQAPFTAPSTASLLTSLYPSELGKITNRRPGLDAAYPTLATLLRQRGYRTFGATSAFILSEKNGFAQGFDHFSSPDLSAYATKAPGPKAIRQAEDTARWMMQTLAQQTASGAPYFSWLHFYDAHMPYRAPDSFTYAFHTEGPFDDERKDFFGFLAAHDGSDKGDRAGVGLLTEKAVAKHSDHYDGQILYIDNTIGQVMDSMSKGGFFDFERDLFVVTADHGELMGEHECLALHEGGYQEVIHIPLMMAGAGLPRKKSIDALTANLDVVPTLLALVDEHAPDANGVTGAQGTATSWRGQDLLGAVRGSPGPARPVVHTELTHDEGYAVHTERHGFTKRIYKPVAIAMHEGFAPSGVTLKFARENGESEIVFAWPSGPYIDTAIAAGGSVKVLLDIVNGEHALNIMEHTAPITGASLHLKNSPFFWAETKWNLLATFEKLAWKVQVLQPGGEVLYDSATVGPIEFKLEPTANFVQLFDLDETPAQAGFVHNRTNRFPDPAYAEIAKQLETYIDGHVRQVDAIAPADGAGVADELSGQDLERLRALGYF